MPVMRLCSYGCRVTMCDMTRGTDSVRRSDSYHALVGAGLVSYGVVHLILASIALHVALTGGGDASQQGALKQLAQHPLGVVALWAMAVNLLALCVWQILEATIKRAGHHSAHQLRRRLSSGGRSVVYLALAVSAARVAMGSRSSSGQSEETVSARLMSVPFGRFLVAAVGVAVIAVGVSQIVKGVRRTFRDDLSGRGGPGVLWFGRRILRQGLGVGSGRPALRLGSLDARREEGRRHGRRAGHPPEPAVRSGAVERGPLGIAAFGVYCLYWARNAKY